MGPVRRIALVSLACLTVTACGSTVQTGDGRTSSMPLGGSTSESPTSGASGGRGDASQGTGAPSEGLSRTPLGGPGQTSTSSETKPGSQPRATRTALSGPGVTASTIKFGAVYDTSNGGGNSSLGVDLNPGDVRDYYNAVAADVNTRGGVLGRRLVPTYLGQSSTTTSTEATLSQQVCDKFTRDQPTFAVLGQSSPIIRSCTRKARMLLIFDGASAAGAQAFAEHPGYVEPASIGLDRVGPVTVAGLAQTDYFAGTPKVGIVAWDDKAYRHSVDVGWKPSLKRVGQTAADTAYIPVPSSNNDLASASAAVSSAVLRFKSQNITHVLILDGPAGVFTGTGLTLLWIKGSGAQQYYPRYGFNTNNSADAGYDAGLWTAQDIREARYVTWASFSAATDAGIPANQSRARCEAIMRKAGVDVSDVAKLAAALAACDEVWVLRESLTRGSGDATLEGSVQGLDSLGSSFRSARSFGTRFGPSRHDGVAAVRLAYFVDSAWQYRGPAQHTDP